MPPYLPFAIAVVMDSVGLGSRRSCLLSPAARSGPAAARSGPCAGSLTGMAAFPDTMDIASRHRTGGHVEPFSPPWSYHIAHSVLPVLAAAAWAGRVVRREWRVTPGIVQRAW